MVTHNLLRPTPSDRRLLVNKADNLIARKLALGIYTVLQPIRCTAFCIATEPGELLPHLFTLTTQAWRLFSVPLLCPHEHLPVRKYGVLRCPDFPPRYFTER